MPPAKSESGVDMVTIRCRGSEIPCPVGTVAVMLACLFALFITPFPSYHLPPEYNDELVADLQRAHDDKVAALESALNRDEALRAARGEPRDLLEVEFRRRREEAQNRYALELREGIADIRESRPYKRFIARWGDDPARLRYALLPERPIYERLKHLVTYFGASIASQYIHSGFGHFLGNMIVLSLFGFGVECHLGTRRYLALYTLGGVVAGLVEGFIVGEASSSIGIGASGCIAALMGAYLILAPQAKISLGWLLGPWAFLLGRVPAAGYLFLYMMMQSFNGMQDVSAGFTSNIGWFAHIGGFAAGCGWMLAREARDLYCSR